MEASLKTSAEGSKKRPPAIPAGFILEKIYSLKPGAEPTLPEVVFKIQSLAISGRLVDVLAYPGELKAFAIPDENGKF